ncbi:hypothetical protein QFC22_003778 [Naganishia vaughanmartiniae]|uniref:Uncharacterized protein n=1 Tax=Naganishia vaughanmartiniae TaxID=1424756 RepID=A0ACC2X463_9TREE|nr:hypothetical protein QFC22_003778 [Naganishia vaughanmartiniae]
MSHATSKSKKSTKASKSGRAEQLDKQTTDGQLDSAFLHVNTDIRLSIPPVFAGDLTRGAMEMLDSLVMRYTPALQAVLLAYSNIQFADTTANILNDCPFAIADVSFNAVVWSPKIGHRLAGSHSLSSASHISLILYKTFNVSIPIHNIPLDEYEFDEDVSAAEIRETDGEVLDSDEEESSDEEDDDDDSEVIAAAKEEIIETGRWRNKRTGKLLGAGGEEIAFTVTGLQVSNQMLSLTGSLKANAEPTSHTFGSNTRPIPVAPGSQLARAAATGTLSHTTSREQTSAAPNAITNPPSNPSISNVVHASTSNIATSASATNSKRQSKHKSSIGVDVASQKQVDEAEREAVTNQRPLQPEAYAKEEPSRPESAEDVKKRRKEEKRARKSVGGAGDVNPADEGQSKRSKKDKKRTATDADHAEDGSSKKKRKKD